MSRADSLPRDASRTHRLFLTEKMDQSRLNRRRFLFFSAIFAFTSVATWFMADLLWRDGLLGLEIALLILFVILFAHVAAGFCTALVGLYVINRGGDSSRITATLPSLDEATLASTAIVMPVFNEDVSRVLEGLRVVYRSVQETKRLEHFDFFVLSDSNQPNQWIQEEVAWVELCKQVGGFGKIFYRKRRHSINKKAGNVADFLRRWAALPLHDRAGRGFHHDGQSAGPARGPDGAQSARGHHSDGAADCERRDAVRARAVVRKSPL